MEFNGKSREFIQCKESIDKNLEKNGIFRMIYMDASHPCNNKMISDGEMSELFKRYEDKGYRVKSINDTIYGPNNYERTFGIGLIIS